MDKANGSFLFFVPIIAHSQRGFKALKQIIKIHCHLGEYDEMLEAYRYPFHSRVVIDGVLDRCFLM